MQPIDWLTVAQAGVMAAAGALLWSIRHAFVTGRWLERIEQRVEGLERRLDRAGKEMSELASFTQGWQERARQIFADKQRVDDALTESRQDRQRLWDAVTRNHPR